MRTWIRSQPGSVQVEPTTLASSTSATPDHLATCSSSPLFSQPSEGPSDNFFTFTLHEERNHFSQSFYPGMNESDAGDDQSSTVSTNVLNGKAQQRSNNNNSPPTTTVTSTLASARAAGQQVNGTTMSNGFASKQIFHPAPGKTIEPPIKPLEEPPSSLPSFQLLDPPQQISTPDSLLESESNNSSPFMTIPTAFPPSTDHGFPDEFFAALRDLFNVLDDSKRGVVKVSDIEKRWVDDDSTEFSPRGLTDCLRKVSTSNGMVDFDRFCAAIKICLLKNQTLLADSVGKKHPQEQLARLNEEAEKVQFDGPSTGQAANQQVPLLPPSEVTFVQGGSVNGNCTLPSTTPYHYTTAAASATATTVNSSNIIEPTNRSPEGASNTTSSKIYSNSSSSMQHPTGLLAHPGHHQVSSSMKSQLMSHEDHLLYGESASSSNGHPIVTSSVIFNGRDENARDSVPLVHRFINKTPNIHHQQQHPHPHPPHSHLHAHPSQLANPVNGLLDAPRTLSSSVHANTRNHIISPCEVPHPLPNPVSLAAINKVTKLTTTTAPLVSKPPHAYSILRRHFSETNSTSPASSNQTRPSISESKGKSNNHHHNHNHNKTNNDTNGLLNGSTPPGKCSTVPRNKERKFSANNLIHMFKHFKLNSVIEKTINSTKGNSSSKESDSSTSNSSSKGLMTNRATFSAPTLPLHQQQQQQQHHLHQQQHQQLPLPPAPPSSHASSSIDFIESSPVPHLTTCNGDTYIPHPPNVIGAPYNLMPPVSIDDRREEDLPLHFQSSRTQMMRRKRDRRHTVSHGIDYNHLKRMQILQHEKDLLLRGLQAVERAKDWYLRQMAEVNEKIRSSGRTFVPVPSESCQMANERLQFRANRIIAANAHLIALMDEANFPIHMNLAFKPLLVPHSTDPIINLNVHPSPSITNDSSSGNNKQLHHNEQSLSEQISERDTIISKLQTEKLALLQLLQTANATSPTATATATNSNATNTNTTGPGSRKGSTSDSPFI